MMKYLEFSGEIIPTVSSCFIFSLVLHIVKIFFIVGQWSLLTHVDTFDYSHIFVYFFFLCDNTHNLSL